jgi:Trypsin
MMLVRTLFFLVLSAALAHPAGAILIRHDRSDEDYRALGDGFPSVGKVIPDGEATLVAPEWVLTAAHVAQGVLRGEGMVRFGKVEYPVVQVEIHPDWRRGESDIALMRLDRPAVGIEPAGLYARRDEVGKIVTFVGRGDYGTGETGPGTQDGVLRGATNRVERATDAWVVFHFDAPGELSTRLEGISGPGDSGGPALVEVKGKLCTLGVSSGGDTPAGGGKVGTYGSREYYVRVSSYLDWIEETLGDGKKKAAASSRCR